ncbi:glycosyltransferase [Phenylobacterium sp.]|uniref:glycosyltransferase n=1 Tax=Phenylobacterium sp. TaxID=1871053 RepID=UPI0035B334F4
MAQEDEVYRVVSTAFDGAFYRAAYPDLASLDADLLRHYLNFGWREGRDPAPWFSTRAYLEANPDVAERLQEPLHHYLSVGRREGREAPPSVHAGAWARAAVRLGAAPAWNAVEPPELREPEPIVLDDGRAAEAQRIHLEQRELVGPEFDADYYMAAYPDVAAAGGDPLDHFLLFGWREGRDPTPRFSIRDYQDAYPDVAEAGINPFVHYLGVGRGLGMAPRQELGFRYDILREQRPMTARVEHALNVAATVKARPASVLAKALAKSRSGLADLHVTFSHDDFTANTGGVQLCLQRESARIADLGRDHLHVFPPGPWPVVRQAADESLLGVLWNGRLVGHFRPEAIVETLRGAAGAVAPGRRTFAIHSLLGHTADEVAAILGAVGLRAGSFWLHDFASLCAGFHLLRNDVQDCGAPAPDSAACSICLYLPYRRRHLVEHERLFNRLDLTVVAPARATLEFWKASWNHPALGERVLPHARLLPRGPAPAPRRDRPFRLAYVGHTVAHKGWSIFRELVLKHEGDDRYEFLHLGAKTPGGLPLSFHEVRVTDEQPRLMQQTLEALEVDAVLVWPLCRETFSFTAYETVAAGCAIVTNPDTGNVQAFVREGGHGWVLDDEAALAEALESGRILDLARARRDAQLYDLEFSALSVDLMTQEAGR